MNKCEIKGCDNNSESLLCKGHLRLRREQGKNKSIVPSKRLNGMALERGECVIKGCNRLTESKGFIGNKRRYTRLCSAHRDLFRGKRKAPVEYYRQPNADANLFIPIKASHTKWVASLDMTICTMCGWEGPCDKHRVKHGKDGGKYHRGNVIVVCPNCHRLIHEGKMQIKCKQLA